MMANAIKGTNVTPDAEAKKEDKKEAKAKAKAKKHAKAQAKMEENHTKKAAVKQISDRANYLNESVGYPNDDHALMQTAHLERMKQKGSDKRAKKRERIKAADKKKMDAALRKAQELDEA